MRLGRQSVSQRVAYHAVIGVEWLSHSMEVRVSRKHRVTWLLAVVEPAAGGIETGTGMRFVQWTRHAKRQASRLRLTRCQRERCLWGL